MKNNSWLRIVLIVLFILAFLIYNLKWMFAPIPDSQRVRNNVSFEGIVTDFEIFEGQHNFGIVRFKIIKSNTKIFNAFQNNKIYPYNINGVNGEIYDNLPYSLKEGDKIYVNSKKGEFKYYENGKLLSKGNLFFILEETWIEFIKKKKRLNN